MKTTVTRQPVPEHQRINITGKLFGLYFPFSLEPFVFSLTEGMSRDYRGGYWEFYTLSNGGFYMAPKNNGPFHVSCENGFEGTLSADALGITVCLYAYSHLSFSDGELAETCAEQYHWLRDYMLEQGEVRQILRAID